MERRLKQPGETTEVGHRHTDVVCAQVYNVAWFFRLLDEPTSCQNQVLSSYVLKERGIAIPRPRFEQGTGHIDIGTAAPAALPS
jgi:hypothetical protein